MQLVHFTYHKINDNLCMTSAHTLTLILNMRSETHIANWTLGLQNSILSNIARGELKVAPRREPIVWSTAPFFFLWLLPLFSRQFYETTQNTCSPLQNNRGLAKHWQQASINGKIIFFCLLFNFKMFYYNKFKDHNCGTAIIIYHL